MDDLLNYLIEVKEAITASKDVVVSIVESKLTEQETQETFMEKYYPFINFLCGIFVFVVTWLWKFIWSIMTVYDAIVLFWLWTNWKVKHCEEETFLRNNMSPFKFWLRQIWFTPAIVWRFIKTNTVELVQNITNLK